MSVRYPLVLLAAGKSTRMGMPKGLFPFNGMPWILHQLKSFREAGGSDAIVVLGYHAKEYREFFYKHQHPQVRLVENPAPERGSFSSLQCGLKESGNAGAVFLSPIDVPLPTRQVYSELQTALMESVLVCQPTFQGSGGHPVLLSRDFVDGLLKLPVTERLDEQIRALGERERRRVPVPESGILLNLNTPGSFQAART